MELLLASGIGLLAACGVWLVLRARSFDVVLGMTLLSYAANLFVFAMGRTRVDAAPLLRDPSLAPQFANYADPLPQALVLTAIVIGFALFVFALAVLKRSWELHGRVETDLVTAVAEEPASDLPPQGDKA